jgi:uncharacterized protein (TIRG00374 family)
MLYLTHQGLNMGSLSRLILYLFITVFSLFLVLYFANVYGINPSVIVDRLLGINPAIILFLLILTIIEFLFKIVRFRACLNDNAHNLPISYLVGIAFSFIVPFKLLGEGVRPFFFNTLSKLDYENSLSAISIERLFDLVFVFSFAIISLSSIVDIRYIFLLLAVLIIFIIFAISEKPVHFAKKIPNHPFSKFVEKYFLLLRTSLKNPSRSFYLLFLTVVIWCLAFVRFWIILFSLGANVDFIIASASSTLAYLGSLLSFLPGGTLGFEGGGAATLLYFGISLEIGISALFIERLLSYWLYIAMGVVLFPLSNFIMKRKTKLPKYGFKQG